MAKEIRAEMDKGESMIPATLSEVGLPVIPEMDKGESMIGAILTWYYLPGRGIVIQGSPLTLPFLRPNKLPATLSEVGLPVIPIE